MKGLAERNLRYMRDFARSWPDESMSPQAVAKLPWGHVRCLLDKLPDSNEARLWYAQCAVDHAWSRKLLEHHIATGRYEREGKALTNFSSTLPSPESELVQQIVHEDYNFEFLGLAGDVHERRLERSLVAEIERFMIELGAGFAFVGRQVQLDVDGEEFFIDMLFFHIPLNRYVVLELKLGKFRPEYAGQINFYVNVVDEQMRHERHDATIGLVLCASRNETVARYALNGIDRPVGIARYTPTSTLAEQVPAELHNQLPEIRRAIGRAFSRFERDVADLTLRGQRSDEIPLRDAVLPAVRIYAQIVAIHPWEDGNGRTAWLVLTHTLVRCGVLAVATDPSQETRVAAVWAGVLPTATGSTLPHSLVRWGRDIAAAVM